ncbi:GntR family transcriptional regulator [Agaribacter marinus]|uniref:GntR family transcriptional regulator n=1 Tax=Agaribacter marinus TaxID=1431249 RepID=A0AA37SUH5_9ALTE|nr:GntR family transcriptional regulator [Agaribacter marinus]GLR69517.1 GntR family transcriptional regulator [Agaribacter marinus]
MSLTNTTNESSCKASRTQQAYAILRERILDNSFKAGEQMLETTLAENLGMSRTPVREACIQLEREGLIKINPRKGILIKPISAHDMSEIYDILCALEPQAARLVAEKSAQGQIACESLERLEKTTADMAAALANDNLHEWAMADEAFHFALLEMCDNQRLKDVVLQFWGQAHRARFFTLPYRKKPVDSTKDHIALVNAIKQGDGELAFRIHAEHRLKGKYNLLNIIKNFDLESL